MLFLTVINLYAIRITLDVLGVVDYGIYNVVASVVASLSFLNGTLTSASQRFLSFHLGKKDYDAYSKTFSLLIFTFIVISFILVIVAEIIGFFFLDDWLVIPKDRLTAAKWVYQATIFTFIFHLLIVPYSSEIIANEKMTAFAYISIIDGVLKLLLVFMLIHSSFDPLIYYGVLVLIVSFIVFLLYVIYCKVSFPFCKIQFSLNKKMFKELMSYTSWNLFGSVSGMLIVQGQSILLNLFFGPVINAAKAIADKVSNVINSFSTNFYMAITPQIIKSYAEEDNQRMLRLGIRSSRLSFFLILFLSYPLIVTMKPVLSIWLKGKYVSDDMIGFTKLALVYCLVQSLEQPITQMIRATGKIKNYQFKVGIWTLAFIPIATVALYLGANALSTMVILILLYIWVMFIRVNIARNQVGLDLHSYLHEVIKPICLVFAVCLCLYIPLDKLTLQSNIWFVMIFKLSCSFLLVSAIIWFVGLTKQDKQLINSIIAKVLHHKN